MSQEPKRANVKGTLSLDEKTIDIRSLWFIHKNALTGSKDIYPPRAGIPITPLINGAEAFPELAKEINRAKKTIDIICWGFDPTLKLDGYEGKERLGDLLRSKATQGVEVRVLIWDGGFAKSTISNEWPVKRIRQNYSLNRLTESNGSMDPVIGVFPSDMNSPTWVTELEKKVNVISKIDEEKIITTQLQKAMSGENSATMLATFEKSIYDYNYEQFNHLQERRTAFSAKRDMQAGMLEDYRALTNFFRHEGKAISEENKLSFRIRDPLNADTSRSINNDTIFSETITFVKGQILKRGATHHQKMVLIDYETPEKAVGFVMGHNLQKHYYDDHNHSFFSPNRWPGFRPWQDISCKVYGPVLYDLNDNFCKAWDKVASEGLYDKRKAAIANAERFTIDRGAYNASPKALYLANSAQICRTETAYNEQVILDLYKTAISNAKNYLYMENQYFRYGALADHLKEVAKNRHSPDKDKEIPEAKEPLYLFVISNPPNSAGETPYTYDMYDRLGYGEALPQVERDIEEELLRSYEKLEESQKKLDELNKNNTSLYDLGASDADDYKKNMANITIYNYKIGILRRKHPSVTARVDEEIKNKGVKTTMEDFNDRDKKGLKTVENTEEADDAFKIQEIPGLKILIGCLKSGININTTKAQYYYTNIYVHSKLLLVDDAFFSLGSANINTRSFKADSELNIAVPHGPLAKATRIKLWQNHAGKAMEHANPNKMSADNYEHWKEVMDKNWENMYNKSPLQSPLTHLHAPDAVAGMPTD